MMKRIKAGQRGFTLLELLVTIPIAGLLMAAATAGLIQLLNSRDASAHMLALRQVQTAGFWVSRDGLQAEKADTITIQPSGSGFPVTFTWTDYTSPNGVVHKVVYTLVGMTGGGQYQLQRQETIGTGSPSTMIVARYLLASAGASDNKTRCWWHNAYEEDAFAFRVTAQVGDQPVQSRDYEVTPRPQKAPG